jgi:molybdopterin converting factor small subunit
VNQEEDDMAVKVVIPTPLRPHTGGRAAAEFPASTVGEALAHLTTEFAALKRHLFNDEGKLRSFVNVYVNGEDIRHLSQDKTPIKDGDTINIIPSIAGGAGV